MDHDRSRLGSECRIVGVIGVSAGCECVWWRCVSVRDNWLRSWVVRSGDLAGFAANCCKFRRGYRHRRERRDFYGRRNLRCGDWRRRRFWRYCCCGRFRVRVGDSVNVDDETVRIGEQECGVLLEVVDVEDDACEFR